MARRSWKAPRSSQTIDPSELVVGRYYVLNADGESGDMWHSKAKYIGRGMFNSFEFECVPGIVSGFFLHEIVGEA